MAFPGIISGFILRDPTQINFGNAVRILTCSCLAFSASVMGGESTNVGADEALSRLLSGDKRFVAGKSIDPTGPALIERRHALAKEQKPFAVVVGCSDSRVPPELVFDVTDP